MAEKIRVLIVDDLATTRESVAKLLLFESEIELIGEATTGLEAINLSKEAKPDIILMDINMPDMDGITASRHITREVPGTQIVMMSVQGETDYMRRAMLAGARDFLVKPFGLDELLTAVHNAYKRRLEVAPVDAQAQASVPQSIMPAGAPPIEDEGKIIAVYSPKGGAGCTTVAINTAMSLSRSGYSTLLVDGDIQFGDITVMMNLKPLATMSELVERGTDVDRELISSVVTSHRSGLRVLAAPSRPEMAEAFTPKHMESLLFQLRDMYAFVIVDTASKLDDINLQILDAADRVLLVTRPELPAIRNASLFLDLTNHLEYSREKVMLMVNDVNNKQGISPQDISRVLKKPAPMVIPADSQSARRAANQGKPIVEIESKNRPIVKALDQTAKRIAVEFKAKADGEEASRPKRWSFLARLFGRG